MVKHARMEKYNVLGAHIQMLGGLTFALESTLFLLLAHVYYAGIVLWTNHSTNVCMTLSNLRMQLLCLMFQIMLNA